MFFCRVVSILVAVGRGITLRDRVDLVAFNLCEKTFRGLLAKSSLLSRGYQLQNFLKLFEIDSTIAVAIDE